MGDGWPRSPWLGNHSPGLTREDPSTHLPRGRPRRKRGGIIIFALGHQYFLDGRPTFKFFNYVSQGV
eukprot:2556295-Pyramimonas_sp.AAC.1